MKIGLLIGLVVIIHHASSFRLGCGCGPLIARHSCGCGIPFPCRQRCPGADLIQGDDWCSNGPDGSGKDCVPLVVRPHDLPKVQLSPQAADQLSQPVAGPCSIKKAIVKPAVLPKPVCRDHHHHHHLHGCGCGSHGCHTGCHSSCHSSCHDSIYHSVHGLGLHGACHHAHGAGHFPHMHLPNGAVIGPDGVIVPGGNLGPNVPGALRPADAVSLDLAYKMARQNDIVNQQSEDRLNFGFRKIPVELPPKKLIRNDVPEEQIFSLNGQIVELKPVRPCRQSASSLAEEAAEELMQLQEEEAAALAEEGGNNPYAYGGPRRPTLGEIGFGAAKPPTPNLVDIPASASGPGSIPDSCECGKDRDICTNCGCGPHVGFHHHGCHHSSCGCHTSHGCHSSCGCSHKCCCKIIPGNVEYKTMPKPQQICLPVPEVPDSCESGEIEISQEEEKVHCSCIPVCVKKCNHCRKSCVTIEKINC